MYAYPYKDYFKRINHNTKHNLAAHILCDFVFYDRQRFSPYQDMDDGFFNLTFVI
jgi:hypothetical protein